MRKACPWCDVTMSSNSSSSVAWWRHEMETYSALLALCAGNSPVPGEFPAQRPVTRSFDVYFDLRPNKRLSKQSWGWWFETLSCSLLRHCNEVLVQSLCHNILSMAIYLKRTITAKQSIFPQKKMLNEGNVENMLKHLFRWRTIVVLLK